ncbi:MAG TPA: enoyl-CoA hydratase/isomerase family protein [Stellaceae bacterium]|nr:enoyl-CoA hydratase/isomerase family protein [Stellaceae bacterium]
MSEDEILFGREGGLATVVINRPQALNALSLDNYRRLAPQLARWADDPEVRAVAIRGAGGRAFCAGGDVLALYRAGRASPRDAEFPAAFFGEEYALVRAIHRYRKPYVAIIDGITMGGGAGISVNGAFRVATEATVFAMPETGIGLFPDVGATRFLNLCPGRVGRYLGLCGIRLQAADALYCGFATHFVPQAQIESLLAALAQDAGAAEAVAATIAGFAGDPGPAPLAGQRPAIDRCFAADTVEAVLAALQQEEAAGGAFTGWAAETRASLLAKSPTSLKITLHQLTLGRGFDVEAALALEYRMAQHVMAAHDFYEGVRAMLIDRDRNPRWRPASLAAVDAAMVASYFAPLGGREWRPE